jgi:hypothetical protein
VPGLLEAQELESLVVLLAAAGHRREFTAATTVERR